MNAQGSALACPIVHAIILNSYGALHTEQLLATLIPHRPEGLTPGPALSNVT